MKKFLSLVASFALNFQCVTTGTNTYVNAGGYHAN